MNKNESNHQNEKLYRKYILKWEKIPNPDELHKSEKMFGSEFYLSNGMNDPIYQDAGDAQDKGSFGAKNRIENTWRWS